MEDTASNNNPENEEKSTRNNDIDNESKCDGDNKPSGQDFQEDDPRRDTGANNGNESKSYPVILEAKPQHPGQALADTKEGKEHGLSKNEHASNTSNNDDGKTPENNVIPSHDQTVDSDTIVQYAVAPKLEGDELQVL